MLRLAENENIVEVLYVLCPNGGEHWILFDPEATLQPRLVAGSVISITTCAFCGPGPDNLGVRVDLNVPLKSGWVTDEEQRQGWTLREPRPKRR